MGASFALMLKRRYEPLWRSTALGATLCFQWCLVVPVGMYLLNHYPDWSLMYGMEHGALLFDPVLLALFYPVTGCVAVILVRECCFRDKEAWAWSMLGVGILTFGLILILGQATLEVQGTSADFIAEIPLLTITQTTMAVELLLATCAILVGWATGMWRLWLLARNDEFSWGEGELQRD
jgi:hypothetical protein